MNRMSPHRTRAGLHHTLMTADGSDVDPDALRAAAASIPELLRLLRDIIIPPPGETGPTGRTGRPGYAATSTAPAKPTTAGTPVPRRHRDQNELQLP